MKKLLLLIALLPLLVKAQAPTSDSVKLTAPPALHPLTFNSLYMRGNNASNAQVGFLDITTGKWHQLVTGYQFNHSIGSGTTNYLPVFTGANTLGNSTAYYAAAGTGISGKFLTFGTATPTNYARIGISDSTVFSSLSPNLGGHGYGEYSKISQSVAGFPGYASFDAQTTISGAHNFVHLISYQARPIYKGSDTIGAIRGMDIVPTQSGSGLANFVEGIRIRNPLGSGPITTSYGMFIEAQNRASSSYGIWVDGGDNYFRDALTVGGEAHYSTARTLSALDFVYKQQQDSVGLAYKLKSDSTANSGFTSRWQANTALGSSGTPLTLTTRRLYLTTDTLTGSAVNATFKTLALTMGVHSASTGTAFLLFNGQYRTAAEVLSDIGAAKKDSTYNINKNLHDVLSASVARTNLGLAIGTNVQAYNANLTAINQALTTTSSPSFTTITAALSGNATTASNLSGSPAITVASTTIGLAQYGPTTKTTGVAGTTTIFASIATINILWVYGFSGGDGFLDQVEMRAGGEVVVLHSNTLFGSPAARTYSEPVTSLLLSMASGTYETVVTPLGISQ